jgi:hypothetical protein
MGYVYVILPGFEVVAVTPAHLFEERPVTQTIEVQEQSEQESPVAVGWGEEPAKQKLTATS